MTRLPCKAALLLLSIAFVACRRPSTPPHDAQRADSDVTDAGLTPDAHRAIARWDGIVSVDPRPACKDDSPTRDAGVDAPAPRRSEPPIHDEGRGEAIERELENWKALIAGTGVDEDRGAMVLVLHQDFGDYQGLRKQLERVAGPVEIVLRPACHSRKEIVEARRLLEERDWHPQAKSIWMGWYFDATFSGFFVSVDKSAPDVARALEQRLGKLVRTRLEDLAPLGNQRRFRRSPRAQPPKPPERR